MSELEWLLGHYFEDPVLHIGVDVAYARDTASLAGVAKHPEKNLFGVVGHKIYKPPVNIHLTVVDALHKLLADRRVAQILYDPYQFKSEAQRLADAGYERLLTEVNQQTEMVEYANTLDSHISQGTLLAYPDDELRSHFSWAAAQPTERGFRIIKRKQSRPIDVVIAIAMALSGATSDVGYRSYPSYREDVHGRSLLELP